MQFLLNLYGYGYVSDDNGFRIDTLEAQQFSREMKKGSRSARLSHPEEKVVPKKAIDDVLNLTDQ